VIDGEIKKWDISTPTKVEGKPTKFGTSCHVILPKEWLKKVVVTVTKERWEELHDTK
jgi:putative transposon-encoded protein